MKLPPISSKTGIFLHLSTLIEHAANHIWSGLRLSSYSIKRYLCVIKKPLCVFLRFIFFPLTDKNMILHFLINQHRGLRGEGK